MNKHNKIVSKRIAAGEQPEEFEGYEDVEPEVQKKQKAENY